MKKIWLVVDVNYLREGLGLSLPVGRRPPPQPVARHRDNDAPREFRINTLRDPAEIANAQPNAPRLRLQDIKCSIANSFEEAHENGMLMIEQQPNLSLIILEATMLLESIPTKPLMKKWNANGELTP